MFVGECIDPDGAWPHVLRREGVTLPLLWEADVGAHPDQRTYYYTPFCQHHKDQSQNAEALDASSAPCR